MRISYHSPLPLILGNWRYAKCFWHCHLVSIWSFSYDTWSMNVASAVTKAGFPWPFNLSNSKQHCRDPSPHMPSSSSLQDIPDHHPLPLLTIILAHTCLLAHITGTITDHQHLKAMRKQSSPADIGKLGEYFLQAFGYDSEAKLAISNAYCLSQSADEFCDFLCPREMPQAEAQWLFDYIIFSNTNWSSAISL